LWITRRSNLPDLYQLFIGNVDLFCACGGVLNAIGGIPSDTAKALCGRQGAPEWGPDGDAGSMLLANRLQA